MNLGFAHLLFSILYFTFLYHVYLYVYIFLCPVSNNSTPLMGSGRPKTDNSERQHESQNRAALDGALYSISSFALVMSLISFFNSLRRRDVDPQSSEMSMDMGDSGPETGTPAISESQQNVDFADSHPGFEDSRASSATDPLRTSSDKDDALLQNFFSRPIKIAEIEWPVGPGLTQDITFNPWELYFEDKRVINRIANFKLMRSQLKLKVMLNGNSFYYGRMLMSYQPLFNLDNTTLIRPGVTADFVEATQRPHIYLNPTESQGGELLLPFFTPKNMIDIPSGGWSDLGRCHLSTLQTLKHANGGTDPVSISIFAWAEDVHLSVLTQADPESIVPQSMEYKGIVSKPASVMAKVAGALSNVPMISNFATATEIGARSIAKMAALFGFSKPYQPETTPFQPVTRQSMADTDGCENILRLTVDTKNELTIDPGVAGVDAKDELVINEIASRESYLTTFDWALGSPVESLLFNVIVDPGIIHTVPGTFPELHMPACSFASQPFEFWRGSLKYRFQVVASGFHKGRLKFVYDPVGTPANGLAEYNTAYTQVVDIAEHNDFCIEVGWGQTTPFRTHLGLGQGSTSYGTSVLGYQSSNFNYGNGTLSVYVVNELTSPNSTVDNDIQINCFVSACDNFELAAPTDYYLTRLGFQPPTLPEGVAVLPELERNNADPKDRVSPQSLEIDSVAIADPPTINSMGPKQSSDSLVNKIHMGEAVASFRTLLKRYNLSEILLVDEDEFNGTAAVIEFTRNMFPLTPGYTQALPTDSNVIESTSSGNYVYSRMTLMNYLVRAFGAWRGGVRYTSDTSYNVTNDANITFPLISDATWSVSRVPSNLGNGNFSENKNVVNYPSTFSLAATKYDLLNVNRFSSGISGATRWTTKVNPIASYEIPYYSQYRFAPGKRGTVYTGADIYQPSYELLGTCLPGLLPYYVYQYVAAGEDFSMMFYLSPPIFYEQGLAPS